MHLSTMDIAKAFYHSGIQRVQDTEGRSSRYYLLFPLPNQTIKRVAISELLNSSAAANSYA